MQSWECLLLEPSTGDTLTSDRSLNKYSTLAAGQKGEELGLMKPLSVISFRTFRAQPSVWSPVTISYGISSSSVLPLIWLLILVVPGGVIRLSFVVSLTFSPSVDPFVHEFSGELNGILHSFWLSRHHTAMDRVGQATDMCLITHTFYL
ncbi:hypothetical protein Tco_0197803 [Tanacetum coccineum]